MIRCVTRRMETRGAVSITRTISQHSKLTLFLFPRPFRRDPGERLNILPLFLHENLLWTNWRMPPEKIRWRFDWSCCNRATRSPSEISRLTADAWPGRSRLQLKKSDGPRQYLAMRKAGCGDAESR